MATDASRALSAGVAQLAPLFNVRGYRRRANTFNRPVGDGLMHVVSFQRKIFTRSGTPELARMRWKHATFTISLGIYIPALEGQQAENVSLKKFISEYRCQVRSRIGSLLPDRAEVRWPVELSEPVVDLVSAALLDYGFPWLAQFETWDQTLDGLESAPDPTSDFRFVSYPRLTAMRMRLARGEQARAEHDFVEHVVDFARSGPRDPDHLDALAIIAQQEGFEVDVVAAADSAISEMPLRFLEERAIFLGEGSYHWMSIKRFSLEPETNPTDVLSWLLRAREYKDTYTSGFADVKARTPSNQGHGPYRAECITQTGFVSIDRAAAQTLVQEYGARFEAVPETLSVIDELIIAPISRASNVWQLPQLSDAANIIGIVGILWDFQELVILDVAQNQLLLIVMAGD